MLLVLPDFTRSIGCHHLDRLAADIDEDSQSLVRRKRLQDGVRQCNAAIGSPVLEYAIEQQVNRLAAVNRTVDPKNLTRG
jgi:hypothetical protein